MAWFEYRQNNSGGLFDENVGIDVWVEADSAEEADEVAQANGIYFDDEFEIDCPCCGTRWSRAWGDGEEFPSEMFTPDCKFFRGFNTNTVFYFKSGANMRFKYEAEYVSITDGVALSPEQIVMAMELFYKN